MSVLGVELKKFQRLAIASNDTPPPPNNGDLIFTLGVACSRKSGFNAGNM